MFPEQQQADQVHANNAEIGGIGLPAGAAGGAVVLIIVILLVVIGVWWVVCVVCVCGCVFACKGHQVMMSHKGIVCMFPL